MKRILSIITVLTMMSCVGCSSKKKNSIELVAEKERQESIFRNLITVVNATIPEAMQSDSLAFLILPVQASCPACRNKTIDSIVSHRKDLADNHFIIISANGGRKTISSYFQENDKRLPVINNQLFLDSTNKAFKLDLYDKKPTIYYTYSRKAYKKVASLPTTVRDDLREFFSGYRNQKQLAKK